MTEERNTEIILGSHSIEWAIKNPAREDLFLYGTDKSLAEFKKGLSLEGRFKDRVKVKVLSTHQLQQVAEKKAKASGLILPRVPSHLFLEARAQKILHQGELLPILRNPKNQAKKIVCLDQITDVNNGAAISRTCAFYGVDYLVFARKAAFKLTPQFYRVASGGADIVPIVQCSNLPRFLRSLEEQDFNCIGLAEESPDNLLEIEGQNREKNCLIIGSEDRGLSHGVRRVLQKTWSLPPRGKLATLNASVAAALFMQRYF